MTTTTSTGFEIETTHITLPTSDGTTVPAYVARPAEGKGNGRGLLVYQEAFGVNEHIRDVTERFARVGYTAIAPALFHRTDPTFESGYDDFSKVMPHMSALTTEGLTADIQAAYNWLTSPEGGSQTKIGAVGYCLGGRVSFLTDLVVPVKAAVSYYGGGIAPNPERGQAGLLDRVADLHAPILLIWGGKDAHLGPDKTRAIDDALVAAGKSHATITFSEADHGFSCDVRASYHPAATAQAQALTLAWFDTYLGE